MTETDKRSTQLKIIYAGSSDISVPTLNALAKHFCMVGVLAAPDNTHGRKAKPCPVAATARELGIPTFQPEHLRTPEREQIATLRANTLVSFSYGLIFGPKFLSLFEHKFNIHPSPLPLLRGPSPIQGTFLTGLKQSEICIQTIAEKMDEGDIWARVPLPISPNDDAETLTQKIAALAPEAIVSTLTNLAVLTPQPQTGEATYTHFINPSDAAPTLDDGSEIDRRVKAFCTWPKVRFEWVDKVLIVTQSSFDPAFTGPENALEGTIYAFDKQKGLALKTKTGTLWLMRLQVPGKKEMGATEFKNGNSQIVGAVLTQVPQHQPQKD